MDQLPSINQWILGCWLSMVTLSHHPSSRFPKLKAVSAFWGWSPAISLGKMMMMMMMLHTFPYRIQWFFIIFPKVRRVLGGKFPAFTHPKIILIVKHPMISPRISPRRSSCLWNHLCLLLHHAPYGGLKWPKTQWGYPIDHPFQIGFSMK